MFVRVRFVIAATVLALCAGHASGQEQPSDTPVTAPATPGNAAAPGDAGKLGLELNKLVPAGNGCQAYFVVDNRTPSVLGELTVDTYFFGKDGVILGGLALQFSELRTGRATVVPFELPDMPCDAISRVLLNKVLTCRGPRGEAVVGCAEALAVNTRTVVAVEY